VSDLECAQRELVGKRITTTHEPGSDDKAGPTGKAPFFNYDETTDHYDYFGFPLGTIFTVKAVDAWGTDLYPIQLTLESDTGKTVHLHVSYTAPESVWFSFRAFFTGGPPPNRSKKSGMAWLIQQREVQVGMSEDEATLAWGPPQGKNNTTTAAGRSEQWVYPANQYLYFDNEVLASFQGKE